jgi:lipopolysaccharide/colanic/teichoic acid biosynthesis glycosyltransferase
MSTPTGAVPSSPTEPFSRWCNSRAKRGFDLVCGSVLLVASSPLMILAAVLIRLTSEGPILFHHQRVGKCGKEIAVLKFRTMVHRAVRSGPEVTGSGDRRITPVGRLLRKWKIDELPQLINVIRGDMSMVGPRPDVAKYFEWVRPQERDVLLLMPGLTSPATLVSRDEEELLSAIQQSQIESFYCTAVLPKKIWMELEYAAKSTFFTDLKVLLQTIAAILFRPSGGSS